MKLIRDALLDQFETAIELASQAKAEYLKQPFFKSARGGPRLSPMFRAWSESTQNLVRLARALKDAGDEEDESKTLEAELSELLADPGLGDP